MLHYTLQSTYLSVLYTFINIHSWGGEPAPFLLIFAHPQILISMCLGQKWGKMGKKYMEREGKSIRFNTLSAYYYHCFLHIKLDISCYILHDSVMTVSS